MRSVHEGARDLARVIAQEDEWITSRRERKKVEMLFAHLKRILRLDRLRLRGPNGARDELDRKSVGEGKRVSGRVDLAGRRIIKKKTHTIHPNTSPTPPPPPT